MSRFLGPLAPHLDRFLTHKHAQGLAYRKQESMLCRMDRLAVDIDKNTPIIDEQFVRRFIADGTPGSRPHRLTLVRQLARFLAVDENRTFVPPRRFLAVGQQRPVIRVLSREEARRFLSACETLTDSTKCPHRGGLVHGTALRVLLLTGLRRGEVIGLKVAEVDLDAGVLTIRRAKFGKSRLVPLADDLAETLREYNEQIQVITGRRPEDAFFPGRDGYHASSPANLYNYFRKALEIAGIAHRGRGNGPSIHSLRHSFAVLRLLAWYERDADLSAKLPLLATYLGHVGLETSQVYLHMTLDIAGEVARRYEAHFGEIITAEEVS